MIVEAIRKLFSWLTTLPIKYDPTITYEIRDIADLRSRDLRKLLIRFGVATGEINRILDKTELQKWVVRLMEEERIDAVNKMWREQSLKLTIIVGILTLFYYYKDAFASLSMYMMEYFKGVSYQIRQQSEMAGIAFRQRMYTAGIMLSAAVILDVLQRWMQMSTAASWILPSDSFARSLLFPYISLPVTADMIVPKDPTADHKKLQEYGLNLAPMIYMAVTGYAKNWLQEKGTQPIAESVLEKSRKKEAKKQAKAQKTREDEDLRCAMSEDDNREEKKEDRADAALRGTHDFEETTPEEAAAYAAAFTAAMQDSLKPMRATTLFGAQTAMDPERQRLHTRHRDAMNYGNLSFLSNEGDGELVWGDDSTGASNVDIAAGNAGNSEEDDISTNETAMWHEVPSPMK